MVEDDLRPWIGALVVLFLFAVTASLWPRYERRDERHDTGDEHGQGEGHEHEHGGGHEH